MTIGNILIVLLYLLVIIAGVTVRLQFFKQMRERVQRKGYNVGDKIGMIILALGALLCFGIIIYGLLAK